MASRGRAEWSTVGARLNPRKVRPIFQVMCGRFVLEDSAEEIARTFGLDHVDDFPPRYNIAPTQPILTVRTRAVPEGSNLPRREAVHARWGLLPPWVKEPKDFPLLINARSETAATKASFRAAMKRRRIIVPASGFYEWKRHEPEGGKGKGRIEPFWVHPRDGGVVAFAGLWEVNEASGGPIDTACIMTIDANNAFRPIHHRMPVVVHPDDFDLWLDCEANDVASVQPILRTPEEGFFEAVPVSDAVNKARNQGPELIERVERAPDAQAKKARAASVDDQPTLL